MSRAVQVLLQRYGIAVLAVALVLLLKLSLSPLLPIESPFLLFFAAVMAGAYYGGLGPGLLATGLALLASNYFFLSPAYAALSVQWEKYLQLALFFLEGTSITVVITLLHTAKQHAESSHRKAQKHEAERLQTEERFRLLIENVKDYGIFLLDPNGYVSSWNAGAERIKGYQAEEILGQHFSRFYTPEDIASGKPAYGLHRATIEGRYECEALRVRKDGSLFWASIVIGALQDEAGRLRGFSKVTRDITERKRAELKIREQADLLDVATDAIVVRDLDSRILFWNQGAERLYGWRAEEVLGQQADQLLYRHPGPDLAEACAIAIAKGEWQGELHKVTRDGREIVTVSRWSLVRDDRGLPKSVLTVDTDITQRKQLEAQFFRVQRLESLGTLAGGIAHDLNNVLTPILAVAQLLPLKVTQLDAQSQQLLEIMEVNARRGADLVKQILSFARGLDGKHASVQAAHLILEIEQIIKSTFPKSIVVETDISTVDLWTISADATQLHQVLMNLCVNARDAMPNGGTLSLTAQNKWLDQAYVQMNAKSQVGPHVVMTVSDTGMGMPPEVLERIFEPFFTTKEVGQGTGLGLSTVKDIVKSHGGFLSVYSEVGRGTQFKVYFPAEATTELDSAADLEVPMGQGELILVVDDEAVIREIAKTTLESHNYQVLTASDGIEAIALYVQHQAAIKVALVDMMMPLMDGLTSIRALQKINPQVQVIITSGLMSNGKLTNIAEPSIQAFLAKPYTIKELLSTLRRVLDAQSVTS